MAALSAGAEAEEPPRVIRRVVTGHDAAGRSVVLRDGSSPCVYHPPGAPNVALTDLWETACVPAGNAGDADAADRPLRLHPPPGGALFRMLELPPDSRRDFAVQRQHFAAMGAAEALAAGAQRHPGFHRTRSLDFIVVVEGEVWALLDEGEVLLRAGDTLVQRGTNHAWANRSDRRALLAGVMLDAEQLP